MNYIAELEKFEIKLEKQNLPIVNGFNLSEYGIDRNIQVGTKFDYPSIR